MITEYQVFEMCDNGIDCYEHGPKHYTLKDGMEDFLSKVETYDKYGRKFKLKYREISDWIEV